MLVRDIMVKDVVTVTETDTLEHAALLLQQGRFRHLPVGRRLPRPQGEEPVFITYPPPKPPVAVIGMLSDRDLPGGRVGVVPFEQLRGKSVGEVMHQSVISIGPETPVEYAANLMAENAIGCLPVVADDEQGRLVGIITESDLFHALVRILGVQEPSTRLRLLLPGGDAMALGQVLLMLGRHGVHLAGMLAGPIDAEGRWPVTLRVRTIYPAPLLRELREAGVQVEQPAEIEEA